MRSAARQSSPTVQTRTQNRLRPRIGASLPGHLLLLSVSAGAWGQLWRRRGAPSRTGRNAVRVPRPRRPRTPWRQFDQDYFSVRLIRVCACGHFAKLVSTRFTAPHKTARLRAGGRFYGVVINAYFALRYAQPCAYARVCQKVCNSSPHYGCRAGGLLNRGQCRDSRGDNRRNARYECAGREVLQLPAVGQRLAAQDAEILDHQQTGLGRVRCRLRAPVRLSDPGQRRDLPQCHHFGERWPGASHAAGLLHHRTAAGRPGTGHQRHAADSDRGGHDLQLSADDHQSLRPAHCFPGE